MAPIYITPGENMFNIQFKKFLSIKHFLFFFKILVLFLLFLQFFRYLITKRFHLLWIDIVILFLSIISASSSLFMIHCIKKSHLSRSVLIFPVSVFCTACPSQLKSCTVWFLQLFQLPLQEYTVLSCMSGLV